MHQSMQRGYQIFIQHSDELSEVTCNFKSACNCKAGPAFRREVNDMISKGPFQIQLLCNAMKTCGTHIATFFMDGQEPNHSKDTAICTN